MDIIKFDLMHPCCSVNIIRQKFLFNINAYLNKRESVNKMCLLNKH